jgi:hypothetical protein
MRNAYTIFVERPKGTRPLGRHRRKWEDNIKKDVRKTGWDVVGWMQMA